MADIVDKSNEQNEAMFRSVLSARKRIGPVPNGRCHNCDEPVAADMRWCDTDCRDDYERRQERA